MFGSFKMQNHDAKIEVEPTSPAQSPPGSTTWPEKSADRMLLDSIAMLSENTSVSVIQHSARLAVVGELLVSVLTHLPVSMRADIVGLFRDSIEDLMSLSDDRLLPQQYHSALLTEVNRYLNALR
jgi:hypothetical protein